ncbi:putative GIY-YIG superfamily endonuclease [Friedmanniella endophytica]|uniref:Putative GIY-YIG superfamily endonuclease n=1 Tax=Microlunatus kandeliicorticis TaxID=1759536 RepID=A0A7W3IT10_9ACTN|nr:GIY-YIG nuclease family protein [Microlunatus kandeliicorticis]MBA8794689.1 putative GIY-YIG superfamily endonuclease [Microlunatus kandeliicorticis]
MPYTYILECADGSLYVGSTRNLDQRVNEHALGTVAGHTATRRPVKLVWYQESERISDAYWLEHQLKRWRREKKLALIEGRVHDLPALARGARR